MRSFKLWALLASASSFPALAAPGAPASPGLAVQARAAAAANTASISTLTGQVSAAALKATSSDVLGATGLSTAGDSLSQGIGATITYPMALSTLTGLPVNNGGITGQRSNQILMRFTPFTVTMSGNQIGTGSTNPVTAIAGAAPVSMTTDAGAPLPLSTKADNVFRTLPGTLCGVHGFLARTATGPIPSTAESYNFRADALSVLTACPANSTFTPDNAVSPLINRPTVIWSGGNDFTNPTAVKANIAALVAQLAAAGNTNYWVLGMINGDRPGDYKGQSQYAITVQLNTDLAAIYGARFIDERSVLVASYNPALQADVADLANDTVPTSLRSSTSGGGGTLTAALDNASCSFSLSAAPAGTVALTFADNGEMIRVTAYSGTSVTACVRGLNGTTAAAHGSGAAYSAEDTIHLNNAGYAIVAGLIAPKITALQQQQMPKSVPLSSVRDIASATGIRDKLSAGCGVPATQTLNICGNAQITSGSSFFAQDSYGNPLPVFRVFGGIIYYGGNYVGSHCFGTGFSIYGNTVATGLNGSCYVGIGRLGTLFFAGGAPTISGSSTLDAFANSQVGTITFAGSPTSVTVTWPTTSAVPYQSEIHCRVSFQTGGQTASYSYTLSALTLTATAGLTGKADYFCDGQ